MSNFSFLPAVYPKPPVKPVKLPGSPCTPSGAYSNTRPVSSRSLTPTLLIPRTHCPLSPCLLLPADLTESPHAALRSMPRPWSLAPTPQLLYSSTHSRGVRPSTPTTLSRALIPHTHTYTCLLEWGGGCRRSEWGWSDGCLRSQCPLHMCCEMRWVAVGEG